MVEQDSVQQLLSAITFPQLLFRLSCRESSVALSNRKREYTAMVSYFSTNPFNMIVYTEQEKRDIPDQSEELNQYHKILAAGGLVSNEHGELLLIFRRGKWDLPKGKLEDNEPIELCAERETKEETGLNELQLQRFLLTTFHTYTEKKLLILKETHWFLYKTPGNPTLTPQTEEDILKAEWVHPSRLGDYTANTFHLIRDVLAEAGYSPE